PFIAVGTVLVVIAPKAAAWLLPLMGAFVVLVPPAAARPLTALRPAGAWTAFSVFGAYALLSALWSADRAATLAAALTYGLFLLSTELAVHGLAHEDDIVIDRLARGVLAGFIVAAAMVAIEVSSGSPIQNKLFAWLPMIGPQGPKFHIPDSTIELLS